MKKRTKLGTWFYTVCASLTIIGVWDNGEDWLLGLQIITTLALVGMIADLWRDYYEFKIKELLAKGE